MPFNIWTCLPFCGCCYIHHFLVFFKPQISWLLWLCYCYLLNGTSVAALHQWFCNRFFFWEKEGHLTPWFLHYWFDQGLNHSKATGSASALHPPSPAGFLQVTKVVLGKVITYSCHLVSALILKAKRLGVFLRHRSEDITGISPSYYFDMDLTHFFCCLADGLVWLHNTGSHSKGYLPNQS